MENKLSWDRTSTLTLILCFTIALFEGFDLQSMGVAALRMRTEFNLDTTQMAAAFSAATLGTLPGSILGGRLADFLGRKKVLIISIILFGIMSVLTAHASSFNLLLLIRFLTGLGMGGALPMMITIASEAVGERWKNTAVSIMYCGIPCGGLLTSVVALMFAGDQEWRHIFYVGGFIPLLLTPLLFWLLPESRVYVSTNRQTHPFSEVLFARERIWGTMQIWISFFGTLIVLYLLLNWLPSLMNSKGLSGAHANYIQMGFNIGGAVGTLAIGLFMDRLRITFVISTIYVGILASLGALAISPGVVALTLSAVGCGAFLIGGQSALYALCAQFYPTQMRGTGVGSAVAIGRLGSFVGPLFAGALLTLGGTNLVIGASIPVIIIATIAALLLTRRFTKK